MFLTDVAIKHYKSLDDVHVHFTPVTVVVGPNGVGKSNFVDALKFLRDIASDGLDHAVISREGIERIRQKYETRPYDIGLKFGFASNDLDDGCLVTNGPYPTSYRLVLSGKGGDYHIASEAAKYVIADRLAEDGEEPKGQPEYLEYDRNEAGVLKIDGKARARKIAPGVVALGHSLDLFDELAAPIATFAKKWRFCSLYPNTLRVLRPPMRETILAEDGSNWASVVRGLKRTKSGRESLDRIAEVMRATVPGFRDITVTPAGGYLLPRISVMSGDNGQAKPQLFDPVQLSDGTLRVFGILLALYQQPAPPLLVIEEPEQTVHPGVLPALAEAFKEASERTQIIITTHSPHLVDQFDPDSIRVAWSRNSLTQISPIKYAQVESVKQHLMSLQEFMLAEGLQPELQE
jgi:predicted ATPase